MCSPTVIVKSPTTMISNYYYYDVRIYICDEYLALDCINVRTFLKTSTTGNATMGALVRTQMGRKERERERDVRDEKRK